MSWWGVIFVGGLSHLGELDDLEGEAVTSDVDAIAGRANEGVRL